TLLEALDAAPDQEEARLRLQAALRRIVEEIRLLVGKRGRDRLAAVQIWFAGGQKHRDYLIQKHRDYLILHRPPKGNAAPRTEGGRWGDSLVSAAAVEELDLRRVEDAAALAEVLGEMDLDEFTTDARRF